MYKTLILSLIAGLFLPACYDEEAVQREAEALGATNQEIEALVDARVADLTARLDTMEAALAECATRQWVDEQGFIADEEDPIATSAGYLTSYTETDPVAMAEGFITEEVDPVATAAGYLTEESDPVATTAGYLTSYTETDPVATSAGYLLVEVDPVATAAGYLTSYTETDPVAMAEGFITEESDPIATAAGYLTSYAETDPVAMGQGFLTAESDPIATAAGYLTDYTESDPVAMSQGFLTTEADPIATAAGYLTDYTETDPVAMSQGFLTTETDPVASAEGYVTAEELELCPVGYVHDASETQFTLCYDPDAALGADEMVRVGDFWIDRYEASAWEFEDCTGDQYGTLADDYPADLPDTGNWTSAAPTVYACSVPGVTPSRLLTWFQAQQTCSASGKSLCTDDQWQAAAAGTWDPGAHAGDGGGACNTDGLDVRSTGDAGDTPGGDTSCISTWGAEDMIANQWEWTADWYISGFDWQTAEAQPAWPWPAGFGDDGTWNVNGQATTGGVYTDGLVAAGLHGGVWMDGTASGVFGFAANRSPSDATWIVGFRCCRSR